jgi:hypothetical protein
VTRILDLAVGGAVKVPVAMIAIGLEIHRR